LDTEIPGIPISSDDEVGKTFPRIANYYPKRDTTTLLWIRLRVETILSLDSTALVTGLRPWLSRSNCSNCSIASLVGSAETSCRLPGCNSPYLFAQVERLERFERFHLG
jgi:hypothetical protein